MKERRITGEQSPSATRLALEKIAVIFCSSQNTPQGREQETVADREVIEVAAAVCQALEETGYCVDVIDLHPACIPDLRAYDWVFNLTETIYGFPLTDFEIASQMQHHHVRFTGSGAHALKNCLDKASTKALLLKNGVNTPAYTVIQPGEPLHTDCRYPVIIKPVHEDGSIGITHDSIAWQPKDLAPRVEHIHRLYQQPALVEEYIEGRDITASILGNGEEAVILPLSEILYRNFPGPNVLTFEAKWLADSPEYQHSVVRCPAVLEPELADNIRRIALQAYTIMGCADYARIDFRVCDQTPYVLEINPNPCINPFDSGFVRSAEAAGFEYAGLVHQILIESVKNHINGNGKVPPHAS